MGAFAATLRRFFSRPVGELDRGERLDRAYAYLVVAAAIGAASGLVDLVLLATVPRRLTVLIYLWLAAAACLVGWSLFASARWVLRAVRSHPDLKRG